MKTDRGTCVAVGVTDAPCELVRTFYVPFEDGIDLVTPVVARSVTLMHERGRALPATADEPHENEAPLADLLADIAQVMGSDQRTRTQTVLIRLAAHNPEEYDGWSLTDLSRELRAHGIRTYKSDGKMVLRSEDVADARAAKMLDQGREDAREVTGRQGVLPASGNDEAPWTDQRKDRLGRQPGPNGAPPEPPQKSEVGHTTRRLHP